MKIYDNNNIQRSVDWTIEYILQKAEAGVHRLRADAAEMDEEDRIAVARTVAKHNNWRIEED
jgi:hypothetical protein